jgi:hypothetical protein
MVKCAVVYATFECHSRMAQPLAIDARTGQQRKGLKLP